MFIPFMWIVIVGILNALLLALAIPSIGSDLLFGGMLAGLISASGLAAFLIGKYASDVSLRNETQAAGALLFVLPSSVVLPFYVPLVLYPAASVYALWLCKDAEKTFWDLSVGRTVELVAALVCASAIPSMMTRGTLQELGTGAAIAIAAVLVARLSILYIRDLHFRHLRFQAG